MIKNYFYSFSAPFLIFFLSFNSLEAQPVLKPSIGISALPNDSDPVCNIQYYNDPNGTYEASGIQEGDTIAHFKLYSLSGTSLDIASELSNGKPVLLIAGSYTCPVFRGKINAINSIASTYANSLSVFIIYIVEPHPIVDVSPYSNTVWTTSQNQNEGVLYEQPDTYLERKTIVSDMLAAINIQVPVYIDGPCNYWWDYFGPAPNNAYLIKPNGVVFKKHGWFNKNPYNMSADIDSLLALTASVNTLTAQHQQVQISPNPFSESAKFTTSNITYPYSIIIYNMLGEKVKEITEINTPEIEINRHGLDNGIYFYQVERGQKSIITGKLIIR